MQTLFALLAALMGGVVIASMVSAIRLESAPNRALADFAQNESKPDLLDRVGQRLWRYLPLDPARWGLNVEWARLAGKHYSLGRVTANALLYGGGVAAALLIAEAAPLLWLTVPAAAALPFINLRAAANEARTAAERGLPEVAALVAAELAANNPPDKALQRAADTAGVLGLILKGAMAEARSSSRPLFSRKPLKGALVVWVERWRLPSLLAFGSSLDLVAGKGVAGEAMMSRIAQGMSREYREKLLKRAEALESNLVLPSAVFFFVPFMAAIVVPVLLPLFETLRR
jgi:tight adherence protein C